uniref:Uncharacterized protein n=1 Tax=Arundo donax TaxID=35708 RepID=A0A0A8YHH2_ARUDO
MSRYRLSLGFTFFSIYLSHLLDKVNTKMRSIWSNLLYLSFAL